MKLLLDTCTFLWITTEASELSTTARKHFEDPVNDVFLSVVSAWEISIKYSLARLPLPESPEKFVGDQRRAHMIESLPLHEEAVFQSLKLPDLHKDPFDRMLVCQAIAHGLTILTPDELIARYPVLTIW